MKIQKLKIFVLPHGKDENQEFSFLQNKKFCKQKIFHAIQNKKF